MCLGKKQYFWELISLDWRKLVFLGAKVFFLEEDAILWVKNGNFWEKMSSKEEKAGTSGSK